ncbi:MAG: DUF4040 domain-containing protein [Oscillospiraceae bacterium]|nr:DUF4040 domain-containing protein [Oscillospiraceae bacterium]
MAILEVLLLIGLVLCALTAVLNRSIMITILTYMGFSLVMSVVWLLLQAPDLAITEAAVGAGVSAVLYFLTLRKIRELKEEADREREVR